MSPVNSVDMLNTFIYNDRNHVIGVLTNAK
ncbi:hypothetical protein VPHK571_0011 [Vibrio phage K571]